MLVELSQAIVTRLSQVPNVSACEISNDLLPDSLNPTKLVVPALLLSTGYLTPLKDPGTGHAVMNWHISLFVIAGGNGGNQDDALALVDTVLPLIQSNTWGISSIGPARLGGVLRHFTIASQGYAVWEVYWIHEVRMGTSEWVAQDAYPLAATPSGIYAEINGNAPEELS